MVAEVGSTTICVVQVEGRFNDFVKFRFGGADAAPRWIWERVHVEKDFDAIDPIKRTLHDVAVGLAQWR